MTCLPAGRPGTYDLRPFSGASSVVEVFVFSLGAHKTLVPAYLLSVECLCGAGMPATMKPSGAGTVMIEAENVKESIESLRARIVAIRDSL
jgi:hypothetical protein